MTGRSDGGERGAALLASVLLMLVLSILGGVSLSLGLQEIRSAGVGEADAAARHLAEAGIDAAIRWFHDPDARQTLVRGGAVFSKQYERREHGSSFFAPDGSSQFRGTAERPDLLLDAGRPDDDRLLNGGSGPVSSLASAGRVVQMKVYGPRRPGLLCTVEVVAEAGGLTRRVTTQLAALDLPSLRAAVQLGADDPPASGDWPVPVWAHWGAVKAAGSVRLGAARDLPVKSRVAPVSGASYGTMERREDRWLDFWVGGDAVLTAHAPGASEAVPTNVYPHQEPVPGLNLDRWDYDTMKRAAMLAGTYYLPGRDGLLYRDGRIEPGAGLTPDEAFRSEGPGDHRGLVFVDTLDARPPRPDNVAALSLGTDYAEGLFVVNAHLRWKPRGPGRTVSVLSPPAEGVPASSDRIALPLEGVHLQGVLVTAGTLTVAGQPRLYGAVMVGRAIGPATGSDDRLEVWYDADLRHGLFRGVPLVYPAPGTWSEQ